MAKQSATRTSATAEAQVFDLGSLAPGQTILVTTTSSKYWLTRVIAGGTTKDHAFGFSIMHSSEVVKPFACSPYRIAVSREVRVGEKLNFFISKSDRKNYNSAGHSGPVQKISYMR